MESIGDYIYIIAIIATIISSFFKKSKKKKKQTTHTPTSQPNPWEEIQRQWEEATQTAPAVQPIPAQQTETKSNKTTRSKHYTQPMSYETTDDVSKLRVKKRPSNTLYTTEETPIEVIDIALDEPNEIRKAILYSEIINRKYT